MNQVAREYLNFLEKANQYLRQRESENIPLTPQLARDGLEALGQFALPKLSVELITDTVVAGNDNTIPVRIYDPHPAITKPVLVFFHGGGHMCGSIELNDAIARRLAMSTDHLVVSVGYRLTPEFPYPHGLNDCRSVVEHLPGLLGNYNVDLEKITLCGDSAGGALATTVAWHCHKNKTVQITSLVLIYPSLDYTFSTPSYQTYRKGFLLETDKIRWYFDQYFQNNEDRRLASPLFFPDLDIMPSTLILAAGCDPLVSEGELFYKNLQTAGVRTEYHHGSELIHCFLNLETLNPDLIEVIYQTIAKFIST